jgi:hypothetical protein
VGGTGQAVEPGDDEGVAFPDVFQAGDEPRPPVRSAALLLLEDLVTVLEFVELDVEALSDRAHPGVPDERLVIHMSL